jgi:hypothetical protein
MKNQMLHSFWAVVVLMLHFPLVVEGQLESMDPGRYDDSWWNRAPYRLVQTNLREIDATMDTDAYVQSMVDASATVVLLNVGGIVANYPTRLPYQFKNPYMKGDLVGELVTKLRAKGIKVIGRFDFSKLNETLAAKQPGWLYVGSNGQNVNYNGQVHTCPNGGYQQNISKEILTEAIKAYPLDGIFFNMIGYQTSDYSGNYHGICQCENCKSKFKEKTGHDLPVKFEPGDPLALEYSTFTRETSEKLFNEIKDHIKSLKPSMMINSYADAGVDMIANESSASLRPGFEWNYSATDNVKRVLGSYKDRSPGNLLIYFQAIGYRHVGTSPNLAKVWMLENMLHGAPLGFVVIGTLVNYEDRVFIPTLNQLYGFHKTNDKLFTNVQSAAKVLVVRGSREEYMGLIKILTEEHIMFDVMEPNMLGSSRNPRKLEDYSAIVLGDVRNMSDSAVAKMDAYVQQGGKLIVTGFTSTNDETGKPLNAIRLKSLGVSPKFEKFDRAQSTYLKISDSDKAVLGAEEFKDFSIMMVYSDFAKVNTSGSSAKGLMKFLPATRFGPPEKSYFTPDQITSFSGVVINTFSAGKAVYIPWLLGAQYDFKGNYMHRTLLISALEKISHVERTIVTDASPLVEMSHLVNRNNAFEWIGMINHSGQIGASFREPVTIANIKIKFKPQKKVKELWLMRGKKMLPFHETNGWVECTVPELKDFEMVVAIY